MDAALRPLAPGPNLTIRSEELDVCIAPAAGGRIAQIRYAGVDWLRNYSDEHAAAIAWGSYPMLPWAGRVRRGRFAFNGGDCQLAPNLGAHAIHGVGFLLPWTVERQARDQIDMSLQLPTDASWPFGGSARQRIAVAGSSVELALCITAGDACMPTPVLGWHPWFRKPAELEFAPRACYPRDAEGIATLPLAAIPPRPWDDCFLNTSPVVLRREGQALRMVSDCDHWVIYDETTDAIGVEPQTGPPDAFNLSPGPGLAPGCSMTVGLRLEWQRDG